MQIKKIIVSTTIVGIIFAIPLIIGLIKHGNKYKIFAIRNVDGITKEETYTYAPRVMELSEKNQFFVKDPYVFENKNKASPFMGETLPAYIMLFLSKIFGAVQNSFIASDIIFPCLIFLLITVFIYKISNNLLSALSGAFTTVLLRDLMLYIPYPVSFVNYLLNLNKGEFLPYSRAFHPQVSFFIFLLFMIFTYLALEKKQIRNVVVAGILFGLLFYTYYFYWTTSACAIFLLLLFFIIKKDRIKLKKLIAIIICGGIISIPYLINMSRFKATSQSTIFFEMSSYPRASLIFIPSLRFFLFAILVYFIKKKKNLIDKIFIIFIFAAAAVPTLSGIILGRDLESIHFVRRLLLPVSTIYVFILISYLRHKFVKYVLIFIILTAVTYGSLVQIKTSEMYAKGYTYDRDYDAAISFLRDKIPAQSVVGTLSADDNLLIPAVTSHYVFLPMSNMTISPADEILVRYFILSKILGKDEKTTISYLEKNLGFFIFYFPWIENNGKKQQTLLFHAKQIMKEVNLSKLKKRYRLNYLFISTKEKYQKKGVKPIYKNNQYEIFKL